MAEEPAATPALPPPAPPDPDLLWTTLHTNEMPVAYVEWGLARASAEPHSVDAAGFFCTMAGKGKVDICRKLVGECGVWPNVPSPNDPEGEKLQAVHMAASEGRLEVVRYLVLECGRKQPQQQQQQQGEEEEKKEKEQLLLKMEKKQQQQRRRKDKEGQGQGEGGARRVSSSEPNERKQAKLFEYFHRRK